MQRPRSQRLCECAIERCGQIAFSIESLLFDCPHQASRFVDLIGPGNTADMFYSARKFDAAEASRMGFLNQVFPAAEFEREFAAFVQLVAENAPLTMAEVKFGIRQVLAADPERDMEGLKRMIDACFASEDYREGRGAFMEKRKPRFKGR